MDEKSIKRNAWMMLWVAFFAGIVMAWAQNKVPPVIGALMEDLSVSMATAGWLSSIFCVTGMIMAIPTAALIKKWGVKLSGVLAFITCIAGTIAGLLAPNATVLMLSRLLEGLGVGIIGVLAPSIITMWFPAEKRGLPMGIWGSWQMAAAALAFLLAGVLTKTMGWQGMWWSGLILLVIGFVFYVWKIASPPAGHNHADSEEEDINLSQVFKSKSTWLVFAMSVAFCVSSFGWLTWMAMYLNEELGYTLEWANSMVGLVYTIEIGTAILAGFLLDKVKSRKRFGFMVSLAYAILLFFSFRLSTSWVMALLIAYPFFEGAVIVAIWTIAPQSVKNSALASGALALSVVGQNIGMVIGPPFIGYFVEKYGWEISAFPLAIPLALSAVFFIIIKLYNEKGEAISG